MAKDIASGDCVFGAGAGDIGSLVFVGNLILVVGILLGVFLLHVAVVSGVEAYWLTKVRASRLQVFRRWRPYVVPRLVCRTGSSRLLVLHNT